MTEIATRELNWFIVNSILAAAGAAVLLVGVGRRLLAPAVPEAVLSAAGLFAIMMMIYPVVSTTRRQRQGRGSSLLRHTLASVAGGILAGLIHVLLS
jgi:Mg2+/citrate symporter